jgi:hypothetical protein
MQQFEERVDVATIERLESARARSMFFCEIDYSRASGARPRSANARSRFQ